MYREAAAEGATWELGLKCEVDKNVTATPKKKKKSHCNILFGV